MAVLSRIVTPGDTASLNRAAPHSVFTHGMHELTLTPASLHEALQATVGSSARMHLYTSTYLAQHQYLG